MALFYGNGTGGTQVVPNFIILVDWTQTNYFGTIKDREFSSSKFISIWYYLVVPVLGLHKWYLSLYSPIGLKRIILVLLKMENSVVANSLVFGTIL